MATAEKTWRGGELSVVKSESPEKRDVDRLLEFAEAGREKCENLQGLIWRLRVGQVICLLMFILTSPQMFGFDFASELGIAMRSPLMWFALGMLVISSALMVAFSENRIRQIRRTLSVEKLALTEAVNLVREVEPLVSQTEDWSLLERAEFRIRLSRFGIGSQTLP